ncbi:MAG: hypothetical protein J6C87_00615 [Bacteroides sp.]|nr:hypothetical protein [Bacteroides sp.]
MTTRLVKGQTYNFVFWAQSESVPYEKGADNRGVGTYYNISDMSNIKVTYSNNAKSMEANNEARDAFLAVRKNLKVNGPINETITLKRPFAQVNVGTKIGSIAEAANAEVSIAKSSMIVKNVATALDTYTGAATETGEIAYALYNIPEKAADEVGDLKNVAGVDYEYLSMNYILVADAAPGTGKQLVNCTLKLYDINETEVNKFDIPNVPVKRNWRTNIIGDILSDNVTFNIVIDPKFDDDHNYVTNEELAYVLANGGEYTLTEDITLTEALTVKANAVLNMGDFNITAAKDVDAVIVNAGAKLTINADKGEMKAVDGSGFIAICSGELEINGGKFSTGKDDQGYENGGVYVKESGKVTINGGYFYNNATAMVDVPEGQPLRYLLNKSDKNRNTAQMIVKGGKFANFNPQDNKAEGANTNFVAAGYYSVATTDATTGETVYEVKKIETNAATYEELMAAVEAGKAVNLTANIYTTDSITVKTGQSVVLNLNSYNIESTVDALVVEGGELIITGEGEVKAATEGNTSSVAVWAKGGKVVICGGSYWVGADNDLRNDCIYAKGGEILIWGGNFAAEVKEAGQYWVLNVNDASYAANPNSIIVKGGTYKNFNPANNLSEGANTNFVASGYKVESTEADANGDVYYTVVKE